MTRFLTSCLALAVLGLAILSPGATPTDAVAANNLKITVPAGTTDVSIGEGANLVGVRIIASDPVVVYLSLDEQGAVVGEAEPAPGQSSAVVSIVVIGDPDEIVFSGRIFGPTPFSQIFPHETGHTEN